MKSSPSLPVRHSAPFLGEEEEEACTRVLRSGNLAQGKEVAAFEEECAAFMQRRYAVALNSGTSSLHLALAALGVQAGNFVAMPSYVCAALLTAVRMQGAEAALCDIGPDYNIAADKVPEGMVTIVPHLFGAPASLPEQARVIIEDVAQSMGGGSGRRGKVAVTSFYATKLMTTGEGGMVFTDEEALADFIRDRRDYDNRDDFVLRYSYKMTDLQAAMGRVQLKRLPRFIERRREIAARYTAAFQELPMRLPGGEGHVYFRYVVALEQRDALAQWLSRRGIEAKRPVYRPAHHYEAEGVCSGEPLAESDKAHRQALSLPLYPALDDAQVDYVIESVCSFFAT